MSAALAGQISLWTALALALLAVVTGWRRLLGASAVAAGVAVTVLAIALVAHDFSLAYVAETTSLATPWPYRVAALWGGMDGSMLFYSTLAIAVSALGLRQHGAVRVAAAAGVGLLGVTLAFANPFVVPDIPAVDGAGLLAILQHPAMIYHPPILYSGLVLLIVPFAMTVSRRPRLDERATWLRAIRPWLYTSWALLTFGMAFGANWAYVELGWGGFWAWDPVENTALMPWLAITVLLHTSRVELATGRLRRWNVFFAGLPFALSVMGVYLTRSGATGSIHSFAEDPVVGRILLGAAVTVAVVVAVVAARSEGGEQWGRPTLDREGWLGLNAALLTLVLVFVTAGSAYPAFRSVYAGDQVVVAPRFYVMTILPLAVLVCVGLTLALGARPWIFASVACVALVLGLATAGARPGVVLMAAAAPALVMVAFSAIQRRPRRRLLVAHVAHLGMALFLIGVAGSALGDEHTGSMRPGDRVEVGGHAVSLVSIESGEADRYVFVRATFDVDGSVLTPEIRGYEDQATPVAEPVVRSRPGEDVTIAVSLLFPDGETVAVSVFVRPLVWWVWVGAAVMGLAGLLALSSRGGGGAGRRRSATGELQPAGTTNDIASE